ncbi:hypothetical protein AB1Y20_004037 [Prymnesium parvum]|uniref:protein acetyllysine N-acetyltransferase n=1 Tax=Prymnesium parvum TaxID=97485 RepID=A0AB34J700_PRYPA
MAEEPAALQPRMGAEPSEDTTLQPCVTDEPSESTHQQPTMAEQSSEGPPPPESTPLSTPLDRDEMAEESSESEPPVEDSARGEPSDRVARALAIRERVAAEQMQRELSRLLRAALRCPSPDRTEDARNLMAQHPEEVAQLRSGMEKTAARKAQQEANLTEVEESDEQLEVKVAELAALLRSAKHAVVYTGAGLSTAAEIPDYRGPQGIWTMHKKGAHNASSAARAVLMGKAFVEALPTLSHMALAQLISRNLVKQIISQNVDGLHLRSGIPHNKLCELHGNVFRERCSSCGREYLRGYDVTANSAYHRHSTNNNCDRKACGKGTLMDTIVYFGEKLDENDLETAQTHSNKADLAIFFGTSLKVLQHYKFIWQQPTAKNCPRKRFVIVNLQPTPKDKQSDLRIYGKCDKVLQRLLHALHLEVPKYDLRKDEVVRKAEASARADERKRGEKCTRRGRKFNREPTEEEEIMMALEASKQDVNTKDEGDNGEDVKVEMGEERELEGEGELAPAKKKRRRKAISFKKASLPRAFPKAPPPNAAAAALEAVEAAAQITTKGHAKEKMEASTERTKGHALEREETSAKISTAKRQKKEPEKVKTARTMADGSKEAEEAGTAHAATAASAASGPNAQGRGRQSKRKTLEEDREKATATTTEATVKCQGKCGFFGSKTYDNYCSKCYKKREAELSAWK